MTRTRDADAPMVGGWMPLERVGQILWPHLSIEAGYRRAHRLISNGTLPNKMIGRRMYVHQNALAAFMDDAAA